MQAETVDDVIRELNGIVMKAREAPSRVGYFAALYTHVAYAIKEHLDEFDWKERMEQLDVAFFRRYLTALQEFRAGGSSCRGWETAFGATRRWRPTVLQHLLLGMNAHINFDLGIAVATVCSPSDLPRLRSDFEKMNDILASLLKGVEDDLAEIWPLYGVLRRYFGEVEDAIINFSMRAARQAAWNVAVELAGLNGEAREAKIAELDKSVGELARRIRRPGLITSGLLSIVRLGECYGIRKNIDILLERMELRVKAGERAREGTPETHEE